MHLFSFRNLFFVLSFRNGKREERWEGKTHGHLFCPHNTKNHQMLPSEIVNSYITLLYLWEFRAPLTSCGLLFGSAHTIES